MDWERADLMRNELCRWEYSASGKGRDASSHVHGRLVHCLTALTTVLAFLAIAGSFKAAAAQDAWVFTNEIPCASAPVYGVPFNRCWTSNVRTFRVGNVQSWRLTYTDSKSEFAIGLYRLVEAHGVGGMSPVPSSGEADWIRTADALKNVTSGAGGWALAANAYVTFQRAQRQCIGFVRNGPVVSGQVNWILGAAFCRESTSPISVSEVQFIADAVQVRD